MRHARAARLVDGADEVPMTHIARHVMDAFEEEGRREKRRATASSTRVANPVTVRSSGPAGP